jgi:hypothetical protein
MFSFNQAGTSLRGRMVSRYPRQIVSDYGELENPASTILPMLFPLFAVVDHVMGPRSTAPVFSF